MDDIASFKKLIKYDWPISLHLSFSTGHLHSILTQCWACQWFVFLPVLPLDMLCYCNPGLWLLGGVIGRVSQTLSSQMHLPEVEGGD